MTPLLFVAEESSVRLEAMVWVVRITSGMTARRALRVLAIDLILRMHSQAFQVVGRRENDRVVVEEPPRTARQRLSPEGFSARRIPACSSCRELFLCGVLWGRNLTSPEYFSI